MRKQVTTMLEFIVNRFQNMHLAISNENKICEIFNDFFSNNIVSNLNFPETECSDDPVSLAIKRYENHPSITKIKNKFSNRS